MSDYLKRSVYYIVRILPISYSCLMNTVDDMSDAYRLLAHYVLGMD